MTAHALAGDSEKSLAAGMNAHIVKPIEPEEMYRSIATWLKCTQQDDPDNNDSNNNQEEENNMDEFPQLPGIDIVEGLERFRGKQASYRRLLLQFRDKQIGVADQLEDLIEQNKWEDAALLAHSIKGNSGNLSAKRLYEASSDLERACRQVDPEVAQSKLAVFRSCLNEVIEGLALLEQNGNTSTSAFDPEAVNTLLKRLEYLLDSDLNKALDCLDKLQRQAAGSHIADSVMKLEAALNTRDIDTAKAIARHLRVA